MNYGYPSMKERLQSTMIDLVFLIFLMYMASKLLTYFGEVPNIVRIGIFIFIWLVYEPLFISIGCTLGNYINGLRVRRFGDADKKINFFMSIIRYLIKILAGWLSLITITSNAERRALHDLAAGSVVYKV